MSQPPQLPAFGPYGLSPAPSGPPETPHRPFVPGTHGLAIAALVLGICGFIPLANILAIVFGVLALVQLRSRTQKGKGLAIGGLCAAGVWLLVLAAAVVIAIVTAGQRSAAGEIVDSGSVALGDLQPGDCVNGVKEGVRVTSLTAVPCAELHEGEVFAVFELASGSFPGDSVVEQQSEDGCFDRLTAYAPNAADDESLEVYYYSPERRTWNRDREVLCLAAHTSRTTGSIRD